MGLWWQFYKIKDKEGRIQQIYRGGGYMTGRGDKEVIMGSVAILKVQYA